MEHFLPPPTAAPQLPALQASAPQAPSVAQANTVAQANRAPAAFTDHETPKAGEATAIGTAGTSITTASDVDPTTADAERPITATLLTSGPVPPAPVTAPPLWRHAEQAPDKNQPPTMTLGDRWQQIAAILVVARLRKIVGEPSLLTATRVC